MLTTIDISPTTYLRDVKPSITLASSRPAQAYVRLVEPIDLPAAPTMRVNTIKEEVSTEASQSGQGLSVDRSRADLVVAQILRLEKFDADWDGSDAAKPLQYSLKDAHLFVRALSPESQIPRVTLHADGHAILFIRDHDVYAELEFLGNSKISFYARRGEQKWSDEVLFDGRSLPEGLSQIGLSL